MARIRFLSGNSLKLIAALTMLIDHMGIMLFPNVAVLRCIGRISFPIFAFMISEGARYTKDKTRYFLFISTFALVCQAVLSFYAEDKSQTLSILVTFSLSILLIYAFQNLKKKFFESDKQEIFNALWLFAFLTVLVMLFTNRFTVDYGFAGVLTPLFASIFDFRGIDVSEKYKKLDNIYLRVLTMSVCLFMLLTKGFSPQPYSLLAIPLLFLYSDKRGKLKMKYFFYVFYPVHLVLLEGIYLLLN